MNKILALAVLLLLIAPMVNAEVQEVDVNYFGEIKTLTGSDYPLTFADWSPDGTKIVSSEWRGGIKIWNASDGTFIMNLTGHFDAVWTAKWSPDGTKIASASWDKTVRVWDGSTGEVLNIFTNDTNNGRADVWGLTITHY